jgi:lipid-A-disaccharide synthase-like uncharacterized protein
MNDAWRQWLYPLGILPAMAFGWRFLLQWIQSEKAQRSVVTASFWKISLIGNILLLIHGALQMQFHVSIIQACNGVISWRNLNLLQPHEKHWNLPSVALLLAISLMSVLMLFMAQGYLHPQEAASWFRIPTSAWNLPTTGDDSFVHICWHAIGTSGLVLFNSRFWVQWWTTERYGTSMLSPLFWWMSLLGALLCIFYFHHIGDTINLIGPLIGIIPYIRNLMLIGSRLPSRQRT